MLRKSRYEKKLVENISKPEFWGNPEVEVQGYDCKSEEGVFQLCVLRVISFSTVLVLERDKR